VETAAHKMLLEDDWSRSVLKGQGRWAGEFHLWNEPKKCSLDVQRKRRFL